MYINEPNSMKVLIFLSNHCMWSSFATILK